MTDTRFTPIKIILSLIICNLAIVIAYPLTDTPFSGDNLLPRWIAVLLGMLGVFAIYSLSAENTAWRISRREALVAVVGAALYAGLLWTSNDASIFVPSASQVAIRPAIAIPVLVGAIFGPVAGFFTGLVGNVAGDVLSQYGVSPQWDMANGLIGLVAGMALLIPVQRRQRTTLTVIAATAVSAVIVTLLFMFNQSTPNQFLSGNEPLAVSAVLGMTPVIGVALLVGAYLAVIVANRDAAVAVAWGGLGNLVGIGFAALADVFVDNYTIPQAFVGEFIPAAGPNMIALAILVPLCILGYAWIVRRSASPQPA